MPITKSFAGLSMLGLGMMPFGDFESIATVTVGSGGASSISFTSIPGTYQHLQIRMMALGTSTNNSGLGQQRCKGIFNGDTTESNYYNHTLGGSGSTAFAGANNDARWIHGVVRNSMIGPSVSIADILDYASTTKYKTTRAFWGWDNNSINGEVRLISGLWSNTAAVTSLTITPETGNFKEHSTAALYGIKA